MAIITCPECNKEISDQAKACPHCGAKKPTDWFWLKLLLGIPVGLFLLVMLIGSCTPKAGTESDSKAQDRRVIKLCWEEQSRKSLDPGAARYAAGMCENMERDFRGKYNQNP